MTNLEYSIIQKAVTDSLSVLSELEPQMFYAPYCCEIVTVIKDMESKGKTVTFDAIRSHFNQSKILHKRHVLDTIQTIENGVFGFVDDFIADVKTKYRNTEIQRHSAVLTKVGTDECTDIDIPFHTEAINSLYRAGSETTDFQQADDMMPDILNRTEEQLTDERIYITHPLLKNIFADYLKPRLYIVSGFSQSGKTLLIDNLVCDIIHKYKGVYFSYDNSRHETWCALMSCMNRMKYDSIENNTLTDFERSKIEMRKDALKNLWIISQPYTAKQIKYGIEKMVKKYGIQYVLLDYFQEIPLEYSRDVVRQMENNVLLLKSMCAEYNITVILLSQLNKEGDAKWCKGLFQEAYMFLKMFRENPDAEQDDNLRVIWREKFKKGSDARWHVTIDGSVGVIQ